MQDPVMDALRARLDGRTQLAVALALGVSTSHLNDVLRGRRKPGPKIIRALGFKKVVSYEKR